jgi:hypothetical protein
MGVEFNSNEFVIKNQRGDIKFSTKRRVPHFIYNITGTVDVPLIGNQVFVNRKDEIVLINNINTVKDENSFILPFYRIVGGTGDTEGKVVTGGGSVILRVIRQPTTGIFMGSTIVTTLVEGGTLKISAQQNMDRTGRTPNEPSFVNYEGDVPVTLNYRVYYGRFQ